MKKHAAHIGKTRQARKAMRAARGRLRTALAQLCKGVTADYIRELYHARGWLAADIAEALGLSYSHVRNVCAQRGVQPRNQARRMARGRNRKG
ncbi:MAG: hypothetical protein IT464_12630 [Planctomycetes bacterium]|nr:hypothetical protein [Planctomycetota bacterium]